MEIFILLGIKEGKTQRPKRRGMFNCSTHLSHIH